MARAPVLALVLAASACSRVPSSFADPTEVELGSTDRSFVPLADGDAIEIVFGPQGGYHVWGAVRARNLDPRAVHMHFTLDRGSGPAVERLDDADLTGTDDGITPGTHVGTLVFLLDPAAVRGRSCRFAVTVTDALGRRASDEHRVFPLGP